MDNDPYINLANAIVESAARDYREVIKALNRNPKNREAQNERRRLEDFFRSSWFQMLTDVDGEYLMAEIRNRERTVVV